MSDVEELGSPDLHHMHHMYGTCGVPTVRCSPAEASAAIGHLATPGTVGLHNALVHARDEAERAPGQPFYLVVRVTSPTA